MIPMSKHFIFSILMLVIVLFVPLICQAQNENAETGLPKIDSSKWLYNADDDVYYQIGLSYCETPADENYENLAVFVPGAYMKGTGNGDGTFTCSVNESGTVGNYTALAAPVVIPVNTPGYSAMDPLSDYTDVSAYTGAGFIYVHAGCRGRNHGAPSGVTDLKAAIRYIRWNADVLPGNMDAVFTFGMSGGGAQSAVLGASGDSALYEPYLEAIGAVRGVSDAVLGSMCWCPITNLDTADEAYEWMMGVTRSGLTDEEQAISDNLAAAFASYINSAGFADQDGNPLTLEATGDGIYQGGSYYDYIRRTIERSLNNFLVDTQFPYDASASSSGGGPGGPGGPGGGRPDGMPGGDRRREQAGPDGEGPMEGGDPDQAENVSFEALDDITRNETVSTLSLNGTYETVQDYINALNADDEWVTYDAKSNKAEIRSIADFVLRLKHASKNLGAFDQLDGGQGENTLFGYGDGSGAHFDATLANILNVLGSGYAGDYAADLEKTDVLGNTVDVRLNMYSPLWYLLESKEGYGTSTPAKYWRIRTGIAQSDCALSTEADLALALMNNESVESVNFETVWGAGHTMAERTGTSTENFITWVNACMQR